jgi:hypothetical protein
MDPSRVDLEPRDDLLLSGFPPGDSLPEIKAAVSEPIVRPVRETVKNPAALIETVFVIGMKRRVKKQRWPHANGRFWQKTNRKSRFDPSSIR